MALALGGGGARGLAHIGVLRVFEMEALRKTTLDMTRQLDLPRLADG